jgi:uncharacterized membrane protein
MSLPIQTIISESWKELTARPSIYATYLGLPMLASFIFSALTNKADSFFVNAAGFIVSSLLSFAVVIFALRLYNGGTTSIDDFNNRLERIWGIIGGQLVIMAVVILGLIALIIPGLYLMLRYSLFQYIYTDSTMGVFEAMKESARLTEGYKWDLLLFFFALVALNILGALCFLIGLAVTIPLSLISFVRVYHYILQHPFVPVQPALPLQ